MRDNLSNFRALYVIIFAFGAAFGPRCHTGRSSFVSAPFTEEARAAVVQTWMIFASFGAERELLLVGFGVSFPSAGPGSYWQRAC